ncbi:msx2-interacting protein isoform X3 [Callorhinchus milii]|uniref:msx2-interacting protein isoform X3 n=1 Tax=Callorhinchus milii TaxID=7868 RepID=UPI001C3FBFA0|nr:msx2-interacting protein isoform X3 [Callorhinchus milii]
MARETRHLWVGNLPENVREDKIIEHFKRYGRVESVKILPKRGSEGGVAAFVDFVDIKSAQKAHNSVNKMGDRDLRTDYNEPATIPSAARGLDDTVPIGTRTREVSGFRGGGGGPTYGPPPSLHGREGRYERRLDGASDNRERTYDHSAYGHHDRTAAGFDRPRHYEQDYFRDPRDRTIQHRVYYGSRSRSPSRFEAHDPRYEQRGREQFAISSVVHRDLYRENITREVRGRRQEKNYQHSRSRSPHSSRSGNQSPQRSSQASRSRRSPSGSGSRSRSSSSDSVSSSSSTSSDSSDSSSSSSDESPARSVQSAAVPAPPTQLAPSMEKDEPRKSYGIKVQNLPVRSTVGLTTADFTKLKADTSLKDGLFHEFKKYGKVTSVQIHGASEDRYGLVFFRQQEDQEKAMNASKGKLFFGMQIEVTAWTGPETESENEFRPLDDRIDEFHPKATRTLFIGNLEKTTTYGDLRNIFERFGEIVDIDIKKVNGVPQYAFLQYCDIASVCKAIKKMDGEYLGNNRLKVSKEKYSHLLIRNIHLSGVHSEILLGFGKSMPTNCVWLDGLSSNITEQYLSRHFCRYGPVLKIVLDRQKGMALVLYDEIECAQTAVQETKGRKIGGNRIKVDFANRESQLAFYRSMEVSGQDMRDLYEIFAERREERRGSFHEYPADRPYFEAVRGPAAVFPEDPRRDYRARSRDFYEWDPYQAEYYDPRYYEDPRDYRDYRDPYEQDIREYSYRQRERERERERYETDRDHERRTCERSQSPTHSRRAQSRSASPTQSERHQSDSVDSERRLYSRSSDHSGSCSSLSPPRYEKTDKPDKIRVERYDKNEKDRLFEPERTDKRAPRKEKVEKVDRSKQKPEKPEVEKLDKKEKNEKPKIRKVKAPSPSSPSSETDQDLDKDLSPDAQKSKTKPGKEKVEKEGTSKNRLDLNPCVVLTRVKEKEAKVVEPPVLEKPRGKPENDAVKSPSVEQNKVQLTRLDQTKPELSKLEPIRPKVPKDKPLASQIEIVDKEVKLKHKKNLKPEQSAEAPNAMDIDKLEARKRRFADSTLRTDRQKLEVKRGSQEEEELRLGLKKHPELPPSMSKEGDLDRRPLRKELLKRDHRKVKQEKMIPAFTPREGQESACVPLGFGLRPSTDAQSRLGEPNEEPIEAQEIGLRKLNTAKAQNKAVVQPSPIDEMLGEGDVKREERNRKYSGTSEETIDHKSAHEKLQPSDMDEKVGIDIDYTQSYRKQMEQSRRLKQQQEIEMAKSEKYTSPRKENADEFEKRSLVHEVGKPPQDVTDDSPPVKRRKTDQFDFEITMKRERNYRSSRQLSEDSEKTVLSPGFRHILSYQDEEENATDSPRQPLLPKEPKDSPKLDPTVHISMREEPPKCNAHEPSKREQTLELSRMKLTSQSSEEETPRWETRLKLDANRLDVSFPSSIIKRDGIRKRSVRELEPGEVPSDSDEDNDKSHSPKASTSFEGSRLPFFLRNRDDRLSDLKPPSSLERNKFYSFALDKTITPDTKALLERAKSLSSSREENWSFLDRDSRFASFRKDKDKEKVESAPRPIPSWYMKKKKIRTDSEGKIDEKKDDHKEEEQERQELFASRFLHSSIFEQDSRRLQHLERKDDDLDIISGRSFGRQGSFDGSSNTPEMVQEPVVLFHSRFIELTRMQQKEKEKDQKPKELERREIENEVQPRTPEGLPELKEPELKIIMPHPRPLAPPPPTTSSQMIEQHETTQDKLASETLVTEKLATSSGESRTESAPVADAPKPVIVNVSPCEEIEPILNKQIPVDVNITADPVVTEQERAVREHPSYLDTKPPTPGGTNLQDLCPDPEPEVLECNTDFSKPVQREMGSDDHKGDKNPASSVNQREENSEVHPHISDNEVDAEPCLILKEKRTSKSKRTKTPVQAITVSVTEKPATRKSERIDREKLKRSSSPRGESQRLQEQKLETEKVSRNTAKSPSSAPESETSDTPLPLGRTRRRNVRSVYATVEEGPSVNKESTDASRSTRKRGEKEIQDSPNVQTPPRRGRPPKSRRRPGDETSPIKAEPVKQEVEEVEHKDVIESPKPAEGWKSPRSQKAAQSYSSATLSSHAGKKGVKMEARIPEICVEPVVDVAESVNQQMSTGEHIRKASVDGGNVLSDQKLDKNDGELEKCPADSSSSELVEKKSTVEKGSKSKGGRGRNAKLSEDKMCLRNLEIRLNTEEVKGVLQAGDGEASMTKSKDTLKEDNPSLKLKDETEHPFSETPKSPENKPECSPEAVQRAKQIELERAVENIAKLTEIPTLHPYKEPSDDSDVRTEEEVEKPAHLASETELAAAIDSIIADESAEADGFPSAPRYPAEPAVAGISEEQIALSTPPESVQPETDQAIANILEADADAGVSARSLSKASSSGRSMSKSSASSRLSKAPIRSVSKSPTSMDHPFPENSASIDTVSETGQLVDGIISEDLPSKEKSSSEAPVFVDSASSESVISKAASSSDTSNSKASSDNVIAKASSADNVIAKAAPSSDTVITKPSSDSVITKPSSDSVITKPSSDSVITKPSSDSVITKPSSDGVISKASSESVITKSSSDSVISKASSESVITKSSSDSVISKASSLDNVVSKASSSDSVISKVSSSDRVISKTTSTESIISKASSDTVISKASSETVISKALSSETVISKASLSETVISKASTSSESVISKVSALSKISEAVVSVDSISVSSVVSQAPASKGGVSQVPVLENLVSKAAVSVDSISKAAPVLTAVTEANDADVCPQQKDADARLQQSATTAQGTEKLPLPEPIEVPRTPGRRGRPKPRNTRRNKRTSASRKGDPTDSNNSEPEIVQVSTDLKQNSVANTVETILEKPFKEPSNKKVVEPLCAAPRSDVENLTRVELGKPEHVRATEPDKEPAAEAVSPHEPLLSSRCEESKSPSYFKLKQPTDHMPEIQPKPNLPRVAITALPTTVAAKIPVTVTSGLVSTHASSGIVPESWLSRHEAARTCSTPPPAPPPDTKASDLDTNSSTLRKILMEPKYVSATNAPTTFVTTSISEPLSAVRSEEGFPTSESKKLVLDEKPAVPPSSVGGPHAPEVFFNEKENLVSSLIAPKVTSVISRMPLIVDHEEMPKVAVNSRGPANLPSLSSTLQAMPLTKQKYRPNLTENSRYQLGTVGFIGDESRPVDSVPLNQGSSLGLRVNTSEGVVVLSYSGQKTEGPQRISAPISQIPPASAVDIEFQQSVSKSQIKQEQVTQAQPMVKSSQTATGYSNVISTHSSSALTGHMSSQPYNTSPVISSIKQEHQIQDKSEAALHSGPLPASQSGASKIVPGSVSQVLVYNLMQTQNLVAAGKKSGEPIAPKVEAGKVPQSTLSPGISPHHVAAMPSKMQSDTNHISSGHGTPSDRTLPLPVSIKQEPHSPRTCVHSPSPFPKVCQPNNTSATSQSINASTVLNAGLSMSQYVPSVHLPEQSVIMPPHSVTQAQGVGLGHLSQGDARMNASSVSSIPYGIRPEAHHPSPRAVLQPQMELRSPRSNTPQSSVIRDLCMPPLNNQHQPDDELMHYGLRRGSGPLQPDVLVMQPDYRLRLDQYNVPQEMLLHHDVRMMYPPMSAVGDVHTEARQARTPEGSVKTPPVSKTPQPVKEVSKQSEVKMAHSPRSEARLIGVPPGLPMSQSVMVSHGVQLMHPVPASFHDFPRVYGELRNFHPPQLSHQQFAGVSPIGINLPPRSMTPQGISEGEHTHPSQRSKTPQISQELKVPAASEHSHHVPMNRLSAQVELQSPHLPHLQRERVQPEVNPTSYPSPTGVSIKHELSSSHQPLTPKQPSFISTPSSTLGAAPTSVMCRTDPQSLTKQEPQQPTSSQRPMDMVQLLTKYPIVWQGLLALKNDTAAVQLHFVSGNNVLAHRSLPAPEGGPPLRIAQRMRLEVTQLEGVARRMTVETDYCLLLALPCGRDQEDVVSQTESLKAGFISYLQLKQAAGIINVPNPGSNQPAYVLQIFPPCEFSESHLSRLAPDLLASISNISPHLMIVIASV